MSKPKLLKISDELFNSSTNDVAHNKLNNPIEVATGEFPDLSSLDGRTKKLLYSLTPIDITDDTIVSFTAPCDCGEYTEIYMIPPSDDKDQPKKPFTFLDALGTPPSDTFRGFKKGSKVSLLLKPLYGNGEAYILNGAYNYDSFLKPQLFISVSQGSTITITGESSTILGKTYIIQQDDNNDSSEQDNVVVTLEDYGRYKVEATKIVSGKTIRTAAVYVDVDSVKQYEVSLTYYATYGIRIDTRVSDPIKAVSYIEGTDAYGMTRCSNTWDNKPIFCTIKPCIFRDGEVFKYLDPDNFNYTAPYIDSTGHYNASELASEYLTENDDIMIEFGKAAYRFDRSSDYDSETNSSDYIDIYVTNDPAEIERNRSAVGETRYCYHSFSYANEGDCDHFYWGAYAGSLVDDKLFSHSGVLPSVISTLLDSRDAAQSKGEGYDIISFYQLVWIQILYLIKYGSLDSRSSLGTGHTCSKSTDPLIVTGSTTQGGMCYSAGYNKSVKLFGIEDAWGNLPSYIHGLMYASTTTDDDPLADENGNYIYTSYPSSSLEFYYSHLHGPIDVIYSGESKVANVRSEGNYLTDVQGTNKTGFFPSKYGGSSTTYYTDTSMIYAVNSGDSEPCAVGSIGGQHNSWQVAGLFNLQIHKGLYKTSTTTGARLSYCYPGK